MEDEEEEIPTTSSPEQDIISKLWLLEPTSPVAQKLIARALDYESLAAELVNAATITRRYEARFIRYLASVVLAEKISWTTYLSSICRFRRFDNYESVRGLCQAVDEALPLLKCVSFAQTSTASELVESVSTAFIWALDVLLDTADLTVNDKDKSQLLYPLKTSLNFVRNPFTGRLLTFYKKDVIGERIRSVCEDIREVLLQEPQLTMLNSIERDYNHLFKKNVYVYENDCSNLYRTRRSTIRTLTSVFSCYRILYSEEEISDIIDAYAQVGSIPFKEIVFDMISAVLLIRIEEYESKSERRHGRPDFSWHILVFFYLKMPKIFALLIKKHGKNPDELVEAVEKILNRMSMSLDLVDTYWKDCTVRSLLRQLVDDGAMDGEVAEVLIDKRYKQMQQSSEVAQYVKTDLNSNDISTLKQAMASTGKMERFSKSVLQVFMGSGGKTLDAIFSSYSVSGKLVEFSSLLAQQNIKAQEAESADKQNTFDYSFLILTRFTINYPNIPLKMIVNGSNQQSTAELRGVFYKWTSVYLRNIKKVKFKKKANRENDEEESKAKERPAAEKKVKDEEEKEEDEEKEKMEVDNPEASFELTKESLDESIQKLKEGQPFWDTNVERFDFESLIWMIPQIGKALTNEYSQKSGDKNLAILSMTTVLTGFVEMPSLFVCLVQWLHSQKDSPTRRLLAQVIIVAADQVTPDAEGRWIFACTTTKKLLQEACEKQLIYPEITLSALSSAERQTATVKNFDIPKPFQLTRAWSQAQVQGWASPHIVRLLELSNNADDHATYMNLFTTKMMKLNCDELMVKSVDMICACITLDFIPSLTIMLNTLTNYMFCEKAISDVRYLQPFVIPLIRQLANILLLSAWACDHELKKQIYTPEEKRARMDDDVDETAIKNLNTAIDATVEKMFEIKKNGLLTAPTCAIFHLISAIAGSPECHAKRLMIKRISPKLLFELSYIDASAISLELFEVFCEEGNVEHDNEKLRFLCGLRRRNII